MARGNDLLQTIEAAHAAALDENLWPDALKALAHQFGAVGATLEDFGKQPLGLRYIRIVGLPSQAETEYLAHYQHHNPRAAYAFRNLSQPILADYVLIDERGMNRDAYYTKYLKSLDLRYFMSGQIMDTAEAQAIVSIQRSRRQGHVEQRDVERMRRLLPHLSQAYDVSLRLRQSTRAVRAFEHVLDLLADGVALIRSDGRIVHANESFQAIARRGDGVRVRKGAIDLTVGTPGSRFAATLAAIARWRAGEADAAAPADFAWPRESGGLPYLISVRPLPRAVHGYELNADAIVFVHDPAPRSTGSMQILRDAFGLTEAEAGVAVALQNGTALGDYARERMLSLNTVYTHLRRIKEKTRCRRMPELIRCLGDLQAPLRGD
jgi:PAS domain-containing protein